MHFLEKREDMHVWNFGNKCILEIFFTVQVNVIDLDYDGGKREKVYKNVNIIKNKNWAYCNQC